MDHTTYNSYFENQNSGPDSYNSISSPEFMKYRRELPKENIQKKKYNMKIVSTLIDYIEKTLDARLEAIDDLIQSNKENLEEVKSLYLKTESRMIKTKAKANLGKNLISDDIKFVFEFFKTNNQNIPPKPKRNINRRRNSISKENGHQNKRFFVGGRKETFEEHRKENLRRNSLKRNQRSYSNLRNEKLNNKNVGMPLYKFNGENERKEIAGWERLYNMAFEKERRRSITAKKRFNGDGKLSKRRDKSKISKRRRYSRENSRRSLSKVRDMSKEKSEHIDFKNEAKRVILRLKDEDSNSGMLVNSFNGEMKTMQEAETPKYASPSLYYKNQTEEIYEENEHDRTLKFERRPKEVKKEEKNENILLELPKLSNSLLNKDDIFKLLMNNNLTDEEKKKLLQQEFQKEIQMTRITPRIPSPKNSQIPSAETRILLDDYNVKESITDREENGKEKKIENSEEFFDEDWNEQLQYVKNMNKKVDDSLKKKGLVGEVIDLGDFEMKEFLREVEEEKKKLTEKHLNKNFGKKGVKNTKKIVEKKIDNNNKVKKKREDEIEMKMLKNIQELENVIENLERSGKSGKENNNLEDKYVSFKKSEKSQKENYSFTPTAQQHNFSTNKSNNDDKIKISNYENFKKKALSSKKI